MPIRGENIGTAYVRIVGDGSGLPDDIRRGFRDAEPSVREAGQEHGRTYGDEFDAELRRSYRGNFGKTQREMFDDANTRLTESLARLELADRFFRSPKWRQFQRRLGDEFGDAGREAGKRLEERFRDSANLEHLADEMGRIGPAVRRAQADILRDLERRQSESDRRTLEQGRMVLQARRMMERDFANRQAAQERETLERGRAVLQARRLMEADFAQRQAEQERQTLERGRAVLQARAMMERDFARRDADLQRLGRMQEQAIRTNLQRDLTNYLDTLQRVERGERGTRVSRTQMIADFNRLRTAADRAGVPLESLSGNIDDIDRRVRRARPGLTRFNGVLDDSADRLGRVFGRGSRNNALNFFGGLAEGVTRLGLLIPRTLAGAGSVISDMVGAFRSARTANDSFFKALTAGGAAGVESLAALGATGPAGLLALAGAALAATLAIGPLVAILASLAGGVVALAGSAFFALASGLVAAAAVAAPLAGALGGIGLGIAYVKAHSDDLSKSLKAVTDSFHGIREAFGDAAFADAGDQAKRLAGILDGFAPLARGIGRAFSTYVSNTLDDLETPGFRNWVATISQRLPAMITSLGESFNNVFAGIGGVFDAMNPEIQRFLGWLEDITGSFADWANSAQGRLDILNFFADARESAKEWGGLLGNVIELIATLFDNGGKDAGDTLIGDLSDKVQEFTDYLNRNPHAIEDWFGDVTDVLRSIGRVAEGIAHLLDVLDSPGSRAVAGAIFGQMSMAIGAVVWAVDKAQDALHGLIGFFRNLDFGDLTSGEGPAAMLITSFSGIGGKILEKIGDIDFKKIVNLPGVSFLLGPFTGLADKILGRSGKWKLSDTISDLSGVAGNILGRFAGMAGRILNRAGYWDLADMISDLGSIAGTVIGKFRGLSGRILSAIGTISLINAFNIPSLGDIAGHFAGLASSILNQIGHIDLGSLMHGSLDPPGPLGPWSWAAGGIADREMVRRIGESGREAVVPLDRPLTQVDPSVRMLSAFAQGLPMATGGVVGAGKTINVQQYISTPATDPRAVAVEAIDRLAAVGY